MDSSYASARIEILDVEKEKNCQVSTIGWRSSVVG